MIIIAKNTTISNIVINDLGSIVVPAEGSYTLSDMFNIYEIARSNELLTYIASGDIVINNGTDDLPATDGIKYITVHNVIQGPKDRSGKLRVHQTSRTIGTTTCWAGVGDDSSDPTAIGGGQALYFEHTTGSGGMSESYYVDFNCVENPTWVHEGYLTWDGCKGDTITAEMVPRVTEVTTSSGTNYNLYGGYLIVPAAPGTGTVDIVSDITTHSGGLIYTPLNDLGERSSAYWDAEWNSTTQRYENITPNYTGTGNYNMFAVEVPFVRFFNKIPMLGNGFEMLQSSDSDELGHGMRIKVITETRAPDHDWAVACVMTIYREKSA